MTKVEKFHSLNIDIEKGIYQVNGRDISESGKYLNLNFEDGEWSLMITEDTVYTKENRITKERG